MTARAPLVAAFAVVVAITLAACGSRRPDPPSLLRLVDLGASARVTSSIDVSVRPNGHGDDADVILEQPFADAAATDLDDAAVRALVGGAARARVATTSITGRPVLIVESRTAEAAGEAPPVVVVPLLAPRDGETLEGRVAARVAFARRLAAAGDGGGDHTITRRAVVELDARAGEIAVLAPDDERGRATSIRVVRLAERDGWIRRARPIAGSPFLREVKVDDETRESFVIGAPGSIAIDVTIPRLAPRLELHGARLFGDDVPVTIAVEVSARGRRERVELELPRGGVFVPLSHDLGELAGLDAEILITAATVGAATDPPLVVIGSPTIEGESNDPRPDVILVSLDTVRADRLSTYGAARETSPALTRLARDAVVFEHAIAPAPWTLPSHATMLSGVLPDRHGTHRKTSRVHPGLPWLPEELRAAGYRTRAFTGGGYVDAEFGFARGFECYAATDPAGPAEDWASTRKEPLRASMIRSARRSIAARRGLVDALRAPRRHPRFFFIHTYAAHEYRAPLSTFERFGVRPGGIADVFDELGATSATFDFDALPDDEREALRARLRDLYDVSVHVADTLVEDVLDALAAANRLENTILIVTSDHGEELFDRGEFGHERSLYEELIRVPLVIRTPERSDGIRVPDVVSIADVAPTVRDLLHLDGRAGLVDGRSVSRALGGAPLDRRPALARGDRAGRVLRTLRGSTLKLLVDGDDARLFDVIEDPLETRDVGQRRPLDLDALRSRLAEQVERLESSPMAASDAGISPALLQHLQELGYLGR